MLSSRLLRRAVLGVLVFAFALPGVGRAGAQTPPPAQLPSIPAPVPVQLDASTTAFLALDFLPQICGSTPACVATLPAMESGLAAARAAGVLVVYLGVKLGAVDLETILPDIAPGPDDPIVASGPDKFVNTNLDQILQQSGIKTVVVTGVASNGAVLYTAFGAVERGYTVVVAEDGISAGIDFATFMSEWQLLNMPGYSNPQNAPLQPNSMLQTPTATLSRTDLISYR